MKLLKFLSLTTFAFFIVLLCTDPKNPYLSSADAGIYIVSKSFNNGDTVSIFTAESLTFVLNLKEHIKNISISTPVNRLWPGTDTMITPDQFDREPFTFKYSFYDTGWQELSITARRDKGDSARENFRVYTRSPLRQIQIRAGVGDTIALSTPPVGDDVIYVWDFRDGTTIKNNTERVSYIVKAPLSPGVGELYVSDRLHRSPSAFFIITPAGGGMRIFSLNDSLSGDTVHTGDVNFTFRANVTGAEPILAATINGAPFDRADKNDSGGFVFSKLFSGINTHIGPMQAMVSITSGAGVITEKTYWIAYFRTIPRSDWPVLHVLFPSKDSLVANAQSLTIRGYVANRAGFDSLAVFLRVDDSLYPEYRRLRADSAWQWTVSLAAGWNHVAVMAFEDISRQGDTLASVRRAVEYAPGAPDTIPPQLITLLGNGAPLTDRRITADPTMLVKAEILDNTGILSVLINGAIGATDSGKTWFSSPVTLTHRINGSPVRVTAQDTSGNKLDTTVTVFFNRPAQFTQIPPTARIAADSLFTQSIAVTDPDGDSVSLTAIIRGSRGDSLLALGNARMLSWRPTKADTGWRSIEVRAWDGYEATLMTLTVYVSPKNSSAVPVRFLTTPADFPDSLIAGKDTLQVTLRTDTVSGTPPKRFTARVIGGPSLLDNSINPVVFWAPTRSDTGMRRLELTVRDSLGTVDSVTKFITVARARPVSVFFDKAGSSAPESAPAVAVVRLSAASTETVSVAYVVDPLLSTAVPADYVLPASRIVTFLPGDTAKTISIAIVDDTLAEPNEVLNLRLISPSAYAFIGIRPTHSHMIIDNDFMLQVTVSPPGSGTVTQTVNGVANNGPYRAGVTVDLTAKPTEGYLISAWSGPVVTTADFAVVRVRMDSTMSVIAGFKIAMPVITVQPIDIYITEGQTAVLGLTATGLNLTYQWQRNQIPITGATNTSYTTPVLSQSDNGARYRCVVSNSGGSITSSEAIVTVSTFPPVITKQPRDTAVAEGLTAAFSVAGTGSALTYQWQKNGVTIPSASLSSYTTPPVTMEDSGAVFRCIVTNSTGSASSAGAALTVRPAAPTITTQPLGQSVSEGATAVFTLIISGSRLTYQWQKNGVNIPLATLSSYTTPPVTMADSGAVFRCIAVNSTGSATSAGAVLAVRPAAPTITTQPSGQSVAEGATATFTLIASGSRLSYQWQKNGAGISGATQPSYTTPAVTMADSGAVFRCIVTNSSGAATSAGASLSVRLVAPTIITQPSVQSVAEGATATFTLSASGSRLSYQWQKNSVAITGATLSSYTTPAVTIADSGAVFRCIVTNSAGAVTSAGAVLSVGLVAPTITTQPLGQNVAEGATATFTLAASGSRLSYQWQKNSVAITGATLSSYTTPAVTIADSGAVFRCIVTNSAGAVTSAGAVLSVGLVAPTITTQPLGQNVAEGATATFTLSASGSRLSYQWQKNNAAISSATLSSYTTPVVTIADSGAVFRCIVTNSAGAVTSAGAVLSVTLIAPTIKTQPSSQRVIEGSSATFTLVASGSRLSYQWQKNGSDITGATLSSYTTPATVFADSGGVFRCVVRNSAGSVTSSQVILNVTLALPVVVTNPSDQTVNETQPATFTAAIRGTNVTYQWQKNGANIVGATALSYTITSTVFADSGSVFRLVAVNQAGTVTTAGAILNVRQLPIITGPLSVSAAVNSSVTFTITVTGGTPPITYQWQKNSVDVPGATGVSYSIASVQLTQNGETYRCVVTNPAGMVTSAAATLTVQ